MLAYLPLEQPGSANSLPACSSGDRLRLALRRGSIADGTAGVGTLLLEDASGHCVPCVRTPHNLYRKRPVNSQPLTLGGDSVAPPVSLLPAVVILHFCRLGQQAAESVWPRPLQSR